MVEVCDDDALECGLVVWIVEGYPLQYDLQVEQVEGLIHPMYQQQQLEQRLNLLHRQLAAKMLLTLPSPLLLLLKTVTLVVFFRQLFKVLPTELPLRLPVEVDLLTHFGLDQHHKLQNHAVHLYTLTLLF